MQPNSWTLDGTLRVVVQGVGKRVGGDGPDAVGAVAGGSQLLATTAVASVVMHGLRAAIPDWVEQMRGAAGPRCLFIGSHYDSTPIKLYFGALQEQRVGGSALSAPVHGV